MTLTADHQRQIAQFMVIAKSYLQNATPAATISDTLGMTKAWYRPPAVLTVQMWNQTFVGAHLSSAAVRLAAVEDVLLKAGVQRAKYKECRWYFSAKNHDAVMGLSHSKCSEWLHVMLRDNAAHEEPDRNPNEYYEKRWRERQDFIEALPFADAYRMVTHIADELAAHLIAQHSFSLPELPVAPC